MSKKNIWQYILTVIKYAITLAIGWLGGNGIETLVK